MVVRAVTEVFFCRIQTVAKIRQRVVEGGSHETPNPATAEQRSSLTRQCVSGRRFARIKALPEETSAWSTDVDSSRRGVDWQMKIDDARCKLNSVYPKIKV